MTDALVVGQDPEELGNALADRGFSVSHTEIGNRPGLEEGGVHDADIYVLTDLEQATSISVAHDLNDDLRIVVYASGSLPEFATRQTDLLVDPALLDPATVAEELADASQ